MKHLDLSGQRELDQRRPVFAVTDQIHALTVSGPDALALMSALTTLPPNVSPSPAGTAALALDHQGHILFGMTILPLRTGPSGAAASAPPDGWLVLTDSPAEHLADHLNSRRFRRRAEATPRPDVRILITPSPVLTAPVAGVWGEARDAWPMGPNGAGATGPRYACGGDHPGLTWTGLTLYPYLLSVPEPLPELLERTGYRRVDAASLDALRIAAWRPLATREAADGKTLPHELDWLRTTTPLNSGCYPGQETVAKIVNVGRPPRRLVFLRLDCTNAALPEAGAAVRLADAVAGEDQPVGHVTSSAIHHELGSVALALVKRSVSPDAGLTAAAAGAPGDAVAARQTVIVPTSGESDSRPARRPPLTKIAVRRRPAR